MTFILERRTGATAARYHCVICGSQMVLTPEAERRCTSCGGLRVERFEARRRATDALIRDRAA
jgi:DNA-directed RNA polymerase subunit RPC12/RpoP